MPDQEHYAADVDPSAWRAPALRVLVVEDQYTIAVELDSMVTRLGYVTVGPVATAAAASRLLENEAPDVALLDVNLRGMAVFPLAAELRRRGIPFAFASGYGSAALPLPYRTVPRLDKPVDAAALARLLAALADRRSA